MFNAAQKSNQLIIALPAGRGVQIPQVDITESSVDIKESH